MKRKLIIIQIIVMLFACSNNFGSNFNNKNNFIRILNELGAYPYLEKMRSPFFIKWKGEKIRKDIGGWISPYNQTFKEYLRRNSINTTFPPSKNKILSWYKKYEHFISSKFFKNNNNKQFKVVLYFLLEIAFNEKLKIEKKEELINLIKLHPGEKEIKLIPLILALLEGKISQGEAIEVFYNVNKVISNEVYLMNMLFIKLSNIDKGSFEKIRKYVNNKFNPVYFRWFFIYKMYEMDKKKYKDKFLEISLNEIFFEKDNYLRKRIYSLIIKENLEEINKNIYIFFERDPDTFCRIQILNSLGKTEYFDEKIIKIIHRIANGRGKFWHYYDGDMKKFEPERYHDELRAYLNFIKNRINDNELLNIVLDSQKKLAGLYVRELEEYRNYFNYLKIK